MTHPTPNISIPVDLTNPGQFFACCGLLELASRLWPEAGAYALFAPKCFHIFADEPASSLPFLLEQFSTAKCDQLDPTDKAASPLQLSAPFNMRLDWWIKPDEDQIDTAGAAARSRRGRVASPVLSCSS